MEIVLSLQTGYLKDFVSPGELKAMSPRVEEALRTLTARSGPGREHLGWLDLPVRYDREELSRIQAAAKEIASSSEVLLVLGIGGSYLGARAALEFLFTPFYNQLKRPFPEVYFLGNSLDGASLSAVMDIVGQRDVSLNVISKSGSTTETAAAFRILREAMERRYGQQEAARRIWCTTDGEKGALRQLAQEKGYRTFAIPGDVGGRFSVLTPVGLLPIAAAGGDIAALLDGAARARKAYSRPDWEEDDCCRYAALRNLFLGKGKCIELLAVYQPSLTQFAEWFKQLFGESEGKDGKGLFPAAVTLTTDLHSMGQYIQEGQRILFETVLCVREPAGDTEIPRDAGNFDGLGFLEGKRLSQINRSAMEGTILAHTQGGVPNILLEVERQDEASLGWLVYFFEKACAVSGYLLGVNPFNQPGVEAYKRNMFALLGKPGYERESEELAGRLRSFEF